MIVCSPQVAEVFLVLLELALVVVQVALRDARPSPLRQI